MDEIWVVECRVRTVEGEPEKLWRFASGFAHESMAYEMARMWNGAPPGAYEYRVRKFRAAE